ncbi:MAG: TIGR02996 domain-containing protein [Planctomycetes bacterium]|nr:TIGR02996 domain-containing protein [Planctomycetota bacterium]
MELVTARCDYASAEEEVVPIDLWDVKQIEAKAPDAKSVTEARKVLAQGDFGKVEPRADGKGWWTICKGMTGTYEVSVKRGPRGGLESACACPSRKKPCKHALALLIYLAEHPEARPEAESTTAPTARDQESLLRAAFAAPEDDTLRLVLADCFEENDQPERAALIRVQCQLARMSAKDAAWKETVEREATTLAAVWKQIGKLPSSYEGNFVRGFLQLTITNYSLKSIGGLPARFVKLFHEGWVESLHKPPCLLDMLPLYRLVGDLDFSKLQVDPSQVMILMKELRLGDPATRTRFVRVPGGYRKEARVFSASASDGD